jgi:CubicO group peptidase (beta-lactamase class C family)
VDAVFSAYDQNNAPGCAVAISENGRLAYSRGYGLADVEWQQPITPDTVFNSGSLAKQFVAFAITLLEDRGKLRLEDDLRKHLPELHALGPPITIHNLLEMTSGIPDHPTLAALAGRTSAQLLDQDASIEIATRIRQLDFEPGTDWAYSNTNYLLLGIIVERSAGTPLGSFLETEIFRPLGMSRTFYSPDPKQPVHRRAEPYVRAGDNIVKSFPLASDGGSQGVQTTVLDLLKWMTGFSTGRIGNARIRDRMTRPRTLSSGEPLTYALALRPIPYRGAMAIRHGGNSGGYTAEAMWFPSVGTGISVLCNRNDVLAETLADRVADAWLGDRLAAPAAQGKLGPEHRLAVGKYINPWGQTLEIDTAGEGMVAPQLGREPLAAAGPRAFAFGRSSQRGRITIGEGRPPKSLVVARAGQLPIIYERFTPESPTLAKLQEYAGYYASDDFGGVARVTVVNGELRLLLPTGPGSTLRPTTRDRFTATGGGTVFKRGPDGSVSGLVVSLPRARQVTFTRLFDQTRP